jgi:hypothetical protein
MRDRDSSSLAAVWVAPVAALLLSVGAWVGCPAVARESGAMPRDMGARRPIDWVESLSEEQVIVQSLKVEEGRLYVNDEPFLVTHRTSIVDERGHRLRLGTLWVGWLVELRYRTDQESELRPYGPEQKVLVQMRVLKRLPCGDDLLE